MRKGIDVSLWQRGLDWNQVKLRGYDFVMIKASESTFSDPRFDEHMKGAIETGIRDIGVYHFFTATDKKAAEEEVKFLLKTIEKFKNSINFYVAIDCESDKLPKNKEELTKIVTYALDTVNSAGYRAILYTNDDWLTYRLGNIYMYPLWLAKYTSQTDIPSKERFPNMKLWQWGIEEIGGIDVDSNLEIEPIRNNDAPSNWALPAIEWAVSNGILKGDENGLRLKDSITREEAVTLIYRLYQKITTK